jgi:alpha-1,3-rhamnosyl/mannosyltransferase
MRPLHIGIDARLPYYRGGGISEYVTALIAALAALRTPERFTIFHSAHDRECRLPADAVNMVRADLQTPCHHPYERLLLATELAPHTLDVFHSPDFIPPGAGAARRVITLHDLAFLAQPDLLSPDGRRHYGGQIQWAVEQADAIVCISDDTRRDVVDRFEQAATKAVTIALAAASRFGASLPAHETAEALHRHGLTRGYVLAVGTLEPRKNLTTLIDAYERLPASLRGTVPLVLAGEAGWRCDDVRAQIEHTRANVRWLGRVAPGDLPHLYAAAGVLAVPSLSEGFGLPVLEAMQSGCPVIASTGGALPATAGDAALLIDPTDVDGWVDALQRVLTDAELQAELRRRGRVRAQEFSWARTAEETLKVYRGRT